MPATLARHCSLAVALVLAFHVNGIQANAFAVDEQQSLEKWIDELSGPANATRDAAEQLLIEAGAAAKAAIESQSSERGLEFRQRAARILAAIEERESRVRQQTLEDQVEKFLKDPENAALPGWERYRKTVGEDQASRNFFLTMLRSEPELLVAYERAPREAAPIFEKRCLLSANVKAQELFGGINGLFQSQPRPQDYDKHFGSLAALLLVAGDEQTAISEEALLRIQHQPAWLVLTPEEVPAPLKKLLHGLLFAPINPSQAKFATWKFETARTFHDSDTLDWLAEIVGNSQQPINIRVDALAALFFVGYGKLDFPTGHLDKIENSLDDATPLESGPQFRDVVLAVLVQKASLPLKDFHLPDETPGLFWNKEFKPIQLSQAQRDEAIAKWRARSQQERNWKNELAAFAGDVGGRQKRSLPGWERFKQFTGDTAESRALFVQMQRAERKLLATLEADEAAFAEKLNERLKTELQSLGSGATLLFLAGDPAIEVSKRVQLRLENFRAIGEPLATALRNPEISAPLYRLIARYDNRNPHLDNQLNAFAKDELGIWKFSLPGWSRYQQIVGADPKYRLFFVEMLRAEPKLIAAYEQGGSEAAAELEACCQFYEEMYPENHYYPYGAFPSLTAMLLVASDEKVQIPEPLLLRTCGIVNRLLDSVSGYSEASFGFFPMHHLLCHWLALPIDEKLEEIAYQKVRLAMKYQRCKDITPLVRVAVNQKYRPEYRAQALLGVAALGEMRQIDLIAPVLKEDTVYQHAKGAFQLRDIALAVLVHMSRQELQDYGFAGAPKNVKDVPAQKLNPHQLFEKPDLHIQLNLAKEREQALAKWDTWYQPNHQLRARLQAFAQGKTDDLPGWARFEKLLGDTSESRKLFIEMQYSDPELLRTFATTPQQVAALLESRVRQLGQGNNGNLNQETSLGSITALLFVGAEEQVQLSPAQNLKLAEMLRLQSLVVHFKGPSKEFLNKLLIRCLHKSSTVAAGEPDLEADLALVRMGVAAELELRDEALHFGLRVLRLKKAGAPRAAAGINQWADILAMTAVAQAGDKSHIADVEFFLDDETEFPFFTHIKIQDYALAVLVRLSRQDYAEYGMAGLVEAPSAWTYFRYDTLGFKEPEQRAKAIAKWRKWSQANAQPQTTQAFPPDAQMSAAQPLHPWPYSINP